MKRVLLLSFIEGSSILLLLLALALPTAAWAQVDDQATVSPSLTSGPAGSEALPAEIADISGATDEWWAAVQEQMGQAIQGAGTVAVWTATGEGTGDYFGSSVANAGDVNGDGYGDIIVGAYWYDVLPGKVNAGKAYAYYGGANGLSATANWSFTGEAAESGLGSSVASAGDVNGDGYEDVVVGAPGVAPGKAYVFFGSAGGLSPTADWSATGESSGGGFGGSVASAGDVNGDGYDDVVVGAHTYDDGANSWAGRAYVYYGDEGGLSTTANWFATGGGDYAYFGGTVAPAGDVNGDGYDDLAVGAPGVATGTAYVFFGSAGGLSMAADQDVTGENAGDEFASSLASAGDVNGDGYDDLIVGAPRWSGSGKADMGKAYIYYGGETGLSTGFAQTFNGRQATDFFGHSVASAGDVNGDGYDDVIIGAYYYQSPTAERVGKAYLYQGDAGELRPVMAWTAYGENDKDYFGSCVSSAGDVNGDGYADLLVAADSYDEGTEYEVGRAYVFLGDEGPSANWLTVSGEAGAAFGASAASAGDVNGDGYTDIIVGAPTYDDNGKNQAGQAYVYLGTALGLDGVSTWTATGEDALHRFGSSVASAGDVNGDGYADIVVGADSFDEMDRPNVGKAYVYYGSAEGLSPAADWNTTGENPGDAFGSSVAPAGDVNGDGYADLVVGAQYFDNGADGNAGKAYVYYGSADGLSTVANWDATGESKDDWFGHSVASAGDVNGDGFADLAVGAWFYDDGQEKDAGKAYVYLGTEGGLMEVASWTATGQNAGDFLGTSAASAGDVNGDGYADLVVGANGFDDGAKNKVGRAYVYHGADGGLSTTADWFADGESADDNFGRSVASAGDLNGDGFADIVVGGVEYARLHNGSVAGLEDEVTWTLTGEYPLDQFAFPVAPAGDVDGDGYADLVLGASGYDLGDLTDSGKIYVYYGTARRVNIFPSWNRTGANGGDELGTSVATAGDVNGDGYSDVVVGAPGYDGATGRAVVYHGGAGGLSTTAASTLTGEAAGDAFGQSVATAGDVNGDGFADLVVGAPGYDGDTGRTYVFPGSAAGLATTAAWTSTGESAGDQFGSSVAPAGDVNGDSFADLVVGAGGYDGSLGKVYAYHGGASGLSAMANWMASGELAGDRFGVSVSSAGDVNGDGYADVIVGADGYDQGGLTDAGKAYLYQGSADGLSTTPAWSASSGTAGDQFGFSVATAGNVNGDAFADIIVGATGYDFGSYEDAGSAYLYHGSAGGPSATPDWMDTGSNPEDRFGYSVASAGDLNGDGYADVIIGASLYDVGPHDDAGRAYAYYGLATGLQATPVWSVGGVAASDRLASSVSSAGDVNGDAYADLIIGAPGLDDQNEVDAGQATTYYGNDGSGRAVVTRQMRGDTTGMQVQPWGLSRAADGFETRLQASNPRGGGLVKLQVQACPAGEPFGGSSCVDYTAPTWTEVLDSVTLNETVGGLVRDALYHWRARVVYYSVFQHHSPWRRFLGQSQDADLRIGQKYFQHLPLVLRRG
jgi:hypothetical protein